MYAQELFVHDSRQWQSTKRVHASFVNFLRIFVFTCKIISLCYKRGISVHSILKVK